MTYLFQSFFLLNLYQLFLIIIKTCNSNTPFNNILKLDIIIILLLLSAVTTI